MAMNRLLFFLFMDVQIDLNGSVAKTMWIYLWY